jgi:hypothetical protein
LTADLQRYFGGTLTTFRRAGLPAREVAAFAANLPRDGAVAWAINPQAAAWSKLDTHLLAMQVDALNGANWQRAGKRGGKPKPLPRFTGRPENNKITTRSMTPSAFDAMRRAKLGDSDGC